MKSFDPIEQPIPFPLVLLGSVCANAILWVGLGIGSTQPVKISTPPELVFDRVAIEKKPNLKPIFHPIQPKPKPVVLPKKEEAKPISVRTPPKPPEGAHNRIITAKPSPKAPADDRFTAPSGGNAKLGAPTDSQNNGNAVVNPPKPPDTPIVTPKPPDPPVTTPKIVDNPPVQPKHDNPVVTPPPPVTPTPPVKPKGETREASPLHQENVEIPENLKSQSFKSFVRVRVNITADGKFTVTLRTSSGNPDVDKLVINTLNKWTWKPALKDGDPVDSVQQFRFNFTIE